MTLLLIEALYFDGRLGKKLKKDRTILYSHKFSEILN